MKRALWTLGLLVVWVALTGDLSAWNLGVGLLVALAAILVTSRAEVLDPPPIHPLRLLAFAGFYVREVVVSTFRVARDVVDPRLEARPAVLAVPLDEHSDEELLGLVNLLTFTPGTLALDLAEDRQTMYVHVMNAREIEAQREAIKAFEQRLRRVIA